MYKIEFVLRETRECEFTIFVGGCGVFDLGESAAGGFHFVGLHVADDANVFVGERFVVVKDAA